MSWESGCDHGGEVDVHDAGKAGVYECSFADAL